MNITRRSMLTDRVHTLDLPVTDAQLAAWRNGQLIQTAMPHLTAAQREFLISGCTDEEWKAEFGGQAA